MVHVGKEYRNAATRQQKVLKPRDLISVIYTEIMSSTIFTRNCPKINNDTQESTVLYLIQMDQK